MTPVSTLEAVETGPVSMSTVRLTGWTAEGLTGGDALACHGGVLKKSLTKER